MIHSISYYPKDRDCALSMLAFEQELASEQLEVLAGNYLAREALEVDQQTALSSLILPKRLIKRVASDLRVSCGRRS